MEVNNGMDDDEDPVSAKNSTVISTRLKPSYQASKITTNLKTNKPRLDQRTKTE